MSGNPEAGKMLNDIRRELHTKRGDVQDEVLDRVEAGKRSMPPKLAIIDWIFAVFDKHCKITIKGETPEEQAARLICHMARKRIASRRWIVRPWRIEYN